MNHQPLLHALYAMLEETIAGSPESLSIADRIAECLGTDDPEPAPLTDAEFDAAQRADQRLRATDPETADAIWDYIRTAIYIHLNAEDAAVFMAALQSPPKVNPRLREFLSRKAPWE
ncbi:MAG: DUF1778 domain-containing protein [Terriglobales bacterium]